MSAGGRLTPQPFTAWRAWIASYLELRSVEGQTARKPHGWVTTDGRPRCAYCGRSDRDAPIAVAMHDVAACDDHHAEVRQQVQFSTQGDENGSA